MTRLIDADALKRYIDNCECCGDKCPDIGFMCNEKCELPDFLTNQWERVINEQPTIDAIPVELIQKRIEYLRELANYAFDTNGGYVEHTHMRLYELEELLEMWAERRTDE